jgi:predicted aspartyl protease
VVASRVITAEREAVVSLTVLGDAGRSVEVEAVLDPGFTGHLTLPPEVVADLGLSLLGSRNSLLADGGLVTLDVYRGRVLWDGRRGLVQVLAEVPLPLRDKGSVRDLLSGRQAEQDHLAQLRDPTGSPAVDPFRVVLFSLRPPRLLRSPTSKEPGSSRTLFSLRAASFCVDTFVLLEPHNPLAVSRGDTSHPGSISWS